ncbi:transcriptional regulatory protein AlgP isoform X2 [Hoplias malabaricus]|uniref:transcriptional regulatory protein AlgP isoform X2 n=1 Tax=Hoplias malabaricus TaxID=27720 RepID=UPI003462EECA
MEVLKQNKVKLIKWLRGDPFILQHLHSKNLITDDEYSGLKAITDLSDQATKLVDLVLQKGPEVCDSFVDLLREDEVNESIPQLRAWIKTVNGSAKPQAKKATKAKAAKPPAKKTPKAKAVKTKSPATKATKSKPAKSPAKKTTAAKPPANETTAAKPPAKKTTAAKSVKAETPNKAPKAKSAKVKSPANEASKAPKAKPVKPKTTATKENAGKRKATPSNKRKAGSEKSDLPPAKKSNLFFPGVNFNVNGFSNYCGPIIQRSWEYQDEY